jgi:hypothetical protein
METKFVLKKMLEPRDWPHHSAMKWPRMVADEIRYGIPDEL